MDPGERRLAQLQVLIAGMNVCLLGERRVVVPGLIAKQDIVSASTMAALLLLLADDGRAAGAERP